MTAIELKTTAIEDVRQLCIKKSWYTRGSNEEYDKLFNQVKKGAAIMEIADDIYSHSTYETCPNVGIVYQEIDSLSTKWKMQLSPDDEL